jgi:serine/threonine protein kinase
MNADDVIARRYRLLRRRGRGGAGEVWEAEDRQTRTRVALKVFVEGVAPPAAFLARLRHPGLVRHLARIEVPGLSAVTMELADESLGQALRRGAHAAVAGLAVLRDVAATLAHLHALAPAIVHGDLKPDNVLLFGGAARLGDIGAVARMTPVYAAPERWERPGAAVAPPADVYAFGVMAHELLAGARPFDGPLAALERLHREAAPPALAATVPAALAALVARCLAKAAADRPSAAALPDQLTAIEAG